MKEINYDGDLSKNINKYNKDFKLLIKIILIFEAIICSLISLPFINLLNVKMVLYLDAIIALISSYLFLGPIANSKKELENITYKLKKNAKVDMSVKELKKAKEIQNVEIISKTSETREEKIIKYFEFLDRNDQIKILKHVKTIVNENKTSNKLFLLEEKDLEKEHIYIKK